MHCRAELQAQAWLGSTQVTSQLYRSESTDRSMTIFDLYILRAVQIGLPRWHAAGAAKDSTSLLRACCAGETLLALKEFEPANSTWQGPEE